jgi:hypothetical protein
VNKQTCVSPFNANCSEDQFSRSSCFPDVCITLHNLIMFKQSLVSAIRNVPHHIAKLTCVVFHRGQRFVIACRHCTSGCAFSFREIVFVYVTSCTGRMNTSGQIPVETLRVTGRDPKRTHFHWLYSRLGPWPLIFHFHDHFTDGRTPWTSDQFVARPLPKHRTTQTQNKQIYIRNIHALCGIRTHAL